MALRLALGRRAALGRGVSRARCASSSASQSDAVYWNDEWKKLDLKASRAADDAVLDRLAFVQLGFGVDQHGKRGAGGATKAAVRACRNALEFNSIPGMVELVPGGRKNMLVHVKLGVPPEAMALAEQEGGGPVVDLEDVAAVFPYGQLLPIEVVVGGLAYGSGRVVPELGDDDDTAVVVAAAVSIGYDSKSGRAADAPAFSPRTWDTRDGH